LEIQVIIPWGQTNNLGSHYNRLMNGVKDWVCFLDHDVLHLHPNWYHLIVDAIKRVGYKAGWISGVTNAIACTAQLRQDAPKNDKIMSHMEFAKKLSTKYGDQLNLMDPEKMPIPFSGFMILTHRKAWEDAGGFVDGFLGVDNEYFKAIVKHGYHAYIMPGLYMYHIYHKKSAWKNF
jgi:GT2 family glycosyltransferase